jgi:hypothetical protein
MKRSKFGQVATAIIMTATAAIPIGTTYEILTHVPASAAASAFPSGQTSVAVVQQPSTGSRVVKKRKGDTARGKAVTKGDQIWPLGGSH